MDFLIVCVLVAHGVRRGLPIQVTLLALACATVLSDRKGMVRRIFSSLCSCALPSVFLARIPGGTAPTIIGCIAKSADSVSRTSSKMRWSPRSRVLPRGLAPVLNLRMGPSDRGLGVRRLRLSHLRAIQKGELGRRGPKQKTTIPLPIEPAAQGFHEMALLPGRGRGHPGRGKSSHDLLPAHLCVPNDPVKSCPSAGTASKPVSLRSGTRPRIGTTMTVHSGTTCPPSGARHLACHQRRLNTPAKARAD